MPSFTWPKLTANLRHQIESLDVVRQFENYILSAIKGWEGLDNGILALDQGEVLDRCRKGEDHQVLWIIEGARFTATKT